MIIVEFDDKQATINDTLISWSEIQRVLLEDKGFLLYYKENYIFIPKEAFDKKSEKTFLKIIKKNLKNHIIDDRRK